MSAARKLGRRAILRGAPATVAAVTLTAIASRAPGADAGLVDLYRRIEVADKAANALAEGNSDAYDIAMEKLCTLSNRMYTTPAVSMADMLAKLTFLVWWDLLPKLNRPWPALDRAYDSEAQWHTDATTEQTLISLWADAHRLSAGALPVPTRIVMLADDGNTLAGSAAAEA